MSVPRLRNYQGPATSHSFRVLPAELKPVHQLICLRIFRRLMIPKRVFSQQEPTPQFPAAPGKGDERAWLLGPSRRCPRELMRRPEAPFALRQSAMLPGPRAGPIPGCTISRQLSITGRRVWAVDRPKVYPIRPSTGTDSPGIFSAEGPWSIWALSSSTLQERRRGNDGSGAHSLTPGLLSFFERAPVQSGGMRVALVISTDELSR